MRPRLYTPGGATNTHLRCHGNAAEEEDDTDRQCSKEADTLAETEPRKLVDEPRHNCLDQHHLRAMTHIRATTC